MNSMDTAPRDGTEILVWGRDGDWAGWVISAYRPKDVNGSGFGSIHSCCGYYQDLEPAGWLPLPDRIA